MTIDREDGEQTAAEVKLSERLEARAAFEDNRVLDEARAMGFVPEVYTGSQTGALLREAAELARSVEDAPVVEIDSEAGEDVRLIAEGGPLDRMTTSVRVIGMHGQRVRLVPEAGLGGGDGP